MNFIGLWEDMGFHQAGPGTTMSFGPVVFLQTELPPHPSWGPTQLRPVLSIDSNSVLSSSEACL